MKRFLFIFLMLPFLFISFSGCEKRAPGQPEEMHWDRDMCERCKMAVSERKYAVQIIDPKSGKVYKFDDIGCAVLWMDEEKMSWKNSVVIWVTDAKTGEWIDARKAKYVEGSFTPMAFGFSAYSDATLPAGAQTLDFEAAARKIEKIEEANSKKLRRYK